MIRRDNGNVHRAAAKVIVSKSRAARGSVCNVLLSDALRCGEGATAMGQRQQDAYDYCAQR